MHVKVSSDGKIWVDGKLAGSVDRPKVKVLLVHESPWSSIVKDSFTFATVAGLVAVGVAMDSVVLQIIGGGMGLFVALAMIGKSRKSKVVTECFTFAEAHEALEAMERDNA